MKHLRWANTEPPMQFMETNTDPSMNFRKATTNPSRNFKKANTELFFPSFFTCKFTSVFTTSFNSNITTNLLHHHEYIVICLSSNSKVRLLYFLCFVHSFLLCTKVASLQFQANGTCRKRPTF